MNGLPGLPQHEPREPAHSSVQILQALHVVHNPRSENSLRQSATNFLEEIKSDHDAPYHGFALSSDRSQSALVRHYGLSLLEHAIRYRWENYTSAQKSGLQGWVVNLAREVVEGDPLYISNKIAGLWVEVAKRSWALDWMDMDKVLAHLWDGSFARKALVLKILETLSEDVFGHEDFAAGLRGAELNRACFDIFTPAIVLRECFPNRETSINVRYGDEGWLCRIGTLLDWCVQENKASDLAFMCATKALYTIKSIFVWMLPRALINAHTITRVLNCLGVSMVTVQLAAVDALLTFYNRPKFSKEDFTNLICPMYSQESIGALKQLFQWSIVEAADIDHEKYLLSKKISEMMFAVGRHLEERPGLINDNCNLSSCYDLLITIMKAQSLHVSIPALHLWVKLLSSEHYNRSANVTVVAGELLEVCSQRMLRYESLPEDSTDPSIVFLNEDVDTIPERHAFLGNYSRFCHQVVEMIVEKQPADALYHLLGQADQVLDHLYDGEPPFQVMTYSKTSVPVLRMDAQCSVIEAALKGYARWLSAPDSGQNERIQETLNSNLQVWCERLLILTFEDPSVLQRIIQLAVVFATGPLKSNAQFAFKVFDYSLNARRPDNGSSAAYTEALKELENLRLHQLQRLAMRFPDDFVTIFEAIEQKINEIALATATDEQTRTRYSSVLFIIIHRATTIDQGKREARLDQFLQPLVAQWQHPGLGEAISSFDGFCDLLGLGPLQDYASRRALHQIPDWSSYPLDEEGKLLQSRIQSALEYLPLRATKTLLSVSLERLEPGSRSYRVANALWHKNLSYVLPNLLHFLCQAQAFHDPHQWSALPLEMKGIVGRILTDRFWQVGISSGTRDDFYAHVGDTKTTLEGLASSVRGSIRIVRETSYRILYYFSLLGGPFYSFEGLPGPLARALFENACAMSTHQLAVLVEMIRPIIENCPPEHRSYFLPPILVGLFEQLDMKTGLEWDRIEAKSKAASADDNLSEEMRDESVLRQLTYSSVNLIVGLLDPHKPVSTSSEPNVNGHSEYQNQVDIVTTRAFILITPIVLKPVILFCTHALRMRDTRSCGLITRVLRSLIPDFAGPTSVAAEVREFISTEVLKACITSLHDPYFVDLQKDLAQLIASIVLAYTPRTDTPKQILQSLPSIPGEKIQRFIHDIQESQQSCRQQRALVLSLLDGLRGVHISEQGKLSKPAPKGNRSAMHNKYNADMGKDRKLQPSPELEGVAEIFDN